MVKRNLDPTLTRFLADILLWVLRKFYFCNLYIQTGIETSFVAILGAMGPCSRFITQGSLSNFGMEC
jgi:small conductance mechanosensitive channel